MIRFQQYTIGLFLALCLSIPGSALAQDTSVDYSAEDSSSDATSTYLKNFGSYFGYDLTVPPTTPSSTETADFDTLTALYFNAQASLASSIPLLIATGITVIPENLEDLAPQLSTMNAYLNQWANNIYTTYTESSESTFSASSLIDQPTELAGSSYLADPVSQSILNILTTPDYTYCTSDHTSSAAMESGDDCKYMSQYKIMGQVLGAGEDGSGLPNITTVASPDYNLPLVPELNANTMLAPLMYNTESVDSSGTGLVAGSQAAQAANFVRYLTDQTQPYPLAKYKTYYDLLSTLTSSGASISDINTAKKSLYEYLVGLRSYAAQMSVGFSNLHYILGRRMQNTQTKTSAAYDEYTLATHRLFNPGSEDLSTSTPSQWLTDMKTAAPGEVDKQMLFLLAEINYQLYLDRKQNERLLLAITAMQMQGAATRGPTLADESEDAETSEESEE